MRNMHAKLNELITNMNAHVRIWMLEKTLPGTVANLNALDAYLNLNDVNAKFLNRSANLNDRNTNLNYGFHGPDLFREFEWLLHQIEWQICEIDRENLIVEIVLSHAMWSFPFWEFEQQGACNSSLCRGRRKRGGAGGHVPPPPPLFGIEKKRREKEEKEGERECSSSPRPRCIHV